MMIYPNEEMNDFAQNIYSILDDSHRPRADHALYNIQNQQADDVAFERFLTTKLLISKWLYAQQDANTPPLWIFCSYTINDELIQNSDMYSTISEQSSCSEIICEEGEDDSYFEFSIQKQMHPPEPKFLNEVLPKCNLTSKDDHTSGNLNNEVPIISNVTNRTFLNDPRPSNIKIFNEMDDTTTVASSQSASDQRESQCIVRNQNTIDSATSDWISVDLTHDDQQSTTSENQKLTISNINKFNLQEKKWYHPVKLSFLTSNYFVTQSQCKSIETSIQYPQFPTSSCCDDNANKNHFQKQQRCDQEVYDFGYIKKGVNDKISSFLSSLPPPHPFLRRRQTSFDSLTYSCRNSDDSNQSLFLD